MKVYKVTVQCCDKKTRSIALSTMLVTRRLLIRAENIKEVPGRAIRAAAKRRLTNVAFHKIKLIGELDN